MSWPLYRDRPGLLFSPGGPCHGPQPFKSVALFCHGTQRPRVGRFVAPEGLYPQTAACWIELLATGGLALAGGTAAHCHPLSSAIGFSTLCTRPQPVDAAFVTPQDELLRPQGRQSL